MGEENANQTESTPKAADTGGSPLLGNPSIKQQSWGTVISIIIIVVMIVIGAFYAWGKRVAENKANTVQSSATTETIVSTSTSTVSP